MPVNYVLVLDVRSRVLDLLRILQSNLDGSLSAIFSTLETVFSDSKTVKRDVNHLTDLIVVVKTGASYLDFYSRAVGIVLNVERLVEVAGTVGSGDAPLNPEILGNLPAPGF